LFIEIVDFLAEGLVHVSSLDEDYYIYFDDKHCLIGENTGKVYRLGDEVQVQVVRVDLEKRRMDFIIKESEADKAAQAGRRGKKSKKADFHLAAAGRKSGKKSAPRGGRRRK
jgi:ribonuclease R